MLKYNNKVRICASSIHSPSPHTESLYRILTWGAKLSTHLLPKYVVSVTKLVDGSYDPGKTLDGVDVSLDEVKDADPMQSEAGVYADLEDPGMEGGRGRRRIYCNKLSLGSRGGGE